MTSGVAVDEACNAMWEEFHGAKVKTRRVITFRINDKFNVSIFNPRRIMITKSSLHQGLDLGLIPVPELILLLLISIPVLEVE
jgi:hypothetical protein